MTDIVYLYPKTSCPCENCQDSKSCQKPKGPKTNMSVRGCSLPECMDCNNRVTIGGGMEPKNKNGYTELNPQVYSDKFAQYFGKIPCQQQGCPAPSYISQDPRLYSTTRYNYLPLDRPPIDGDVRLKNIYDKKYDWYNYNQNPYENIRDGQIEYYIDHSIEEPFFNPLFSQQAKDVAVLYKDPMGGVKPEYSRIPQNTYNPTVAKPKSYLNCLSFIEDTQAHREDMLSYQMRKRNQQRWSPRWSME